MVTAGGAIVVPVTASLTVAVTGGFAGVDKTVTFNCVTYCVNCVPVPTFSASKDVFMPGAYVGARAQWPIALPGIPAAAFVLQYKHVFAFGENVSLGSVAQDRIVGFNVAQDLDLVTAGVNALPASDVGAAENGGADQNADAERDSDRDERTVLDFVRDLPQRVIAVFGPEIERLIAETPGLVAGYLAALPETTHHIAEDRGNRIPDLVGRACGGDGRSAAGDTPDPFELLFNGAEMLLDRGYARAEIR